MTLLTASSAARTTASVSASRRPPALQTASTNARATGKKRKSLGRVRTGGAISDDTAFPPSILRFYDRGKSLASRSAAQRLDILIGQASRLRNAIPRPRRQDRPNRAFQVEAMAHRNQHRLDARLRANDLADDFALVRERRPRTYSNSRRLERTDESAFRASQARPIQPQPHVAGEAESAWMRKAVAVK